MIEIRSPTPKETSVIVDILVDAFSDKLSYIFNNEMDKAREITAKYYSTMSLDELNSHYVAVEDGIVLGAMHLKYKGGPKRSGSVAISEMIQRLGVFRGLSATASLILFTSDDFKPDTCHVSFLAVMPDARSKGIGTQLMDYAIEFAKSKKLPKLSLNVVGSNTGAIRLYERLGFHTEKQENSIIARFFLGFAGYSYMEKTL